jgi:ABC-type transport system involved in multi-copper enzyme maturation permease subunit
MSKVMVIAWLTFHEAVRRRVVLAAVALGALFLLIYNAGVIFLLSDASANLGQAAQQLTSSLSDEVYSFLLSMGLYVVHFLTIMLAIFASVDTLAGEIRSHTVQSLVTKPVPRWQLVMGKWLGYAVMICVYVALLSSGITLSIYFITGFVPPNFVPAILLMALEALVLLSLSMLLGTRLSTLTNGVVLFMLFGLAFVGSWIEQFGTILQSHAATNVGIITSLVMPVEALWSLIAYLIQPPLVGGLPSTLRLSPLLGTASVPSPAMVVYAVAYTVLMLALAMRAFSRRDL